MEQTTLKLVRLLAPGFLLMMLIEPLTGLIPETWRANNFPLEFVKFPQYVVVFVFFYAALNLRDLSNWMFLKQVDQNIRGKLWEMAHPSVAPPTDWTTAYALQVFYGLIDSNESLKLKASNIRFNGALLTTAADARAVSFMIALGALFLGWRFGYSDEVVTALIVNISVFLISFVLSERLTNEHIKLGGQQVDFIRMNLRSELVKKLSDAGY